jgi:hypothetical protein
MRQFGNGHVPVLGCIVEQHAANLRAEGAQWHIIAFHRVAAGGVHHPAEARIAVEFLDNGRGHDPDSVPVGIELFRDDQRQ